MYNKLLISLLGNILGTIESIVIDSNISDNYYKQQLKDSWDKIKEIQERLGEN